MVTSPTTRDGLSLHLIHHQLPVARGTVLIVHGLGEHLGRYSHVVRRLLDARWAVSIYDQRGHGRSDGPRGAIAQDDDLLADLGVVVDDIKRHQPGPLVLLGHSLGGLVAARFVAEGVRSSAARLGWHRDVDALVLSSPALDPGLSMLQRLLVASLPRLAPDLTVSNGLNPAWISRDPAVVRAYTNDPLVHDRVNARLARCIAVLGRQVQEAAPHWTVPTLLMWSGIDRCVAARGSVTFAAAVPPAKMRAMPWQALAHEIFNEPERGQVLDAVVAWLDALPH